MQSSTTNDEQPASQNVNTKKDSATTRQHNQIKKKVSINKTKVNLLIKNGNDNRAAHVENHEANVVTASDSSDNGNVQHNRNELQAFFDANYHDYRFIDRENADSGTFNYVKGIFDKINTLLGSNNNQLTIRLATCIQRIGTSCCFNSYNASTSCNKLAVDQTEFKRVLLSLELQSLR
ncbi:hypothetical protein ACVPOS_11930 [Staphylococcus aureus]